MGPKVDRQADFKRILCATDFSPAAENAIPYAMSLAEAYHVSLLFLHVNDWSNNEKPSAALDSLSGLESHDDEIGFFIGGGFQEESRLAHPRFDDIRRHRSGALPRLDRAIEEDAFGKMMRFMFHLLPDTLSVDVDKD